MKVVFRCDPALIDRLPEPILARQGIPDWLRRMPASALSETHGRDLRTVKHCPPFVDAMMHGFLMTLPCDVEVAGGRFSWSWNVPDLGPIMHPRAPLSFHVPDQVAQTPFADGRTIIKFNSFWTIALEEGYSLFATHPVNRTDLPFRTLSGLVDSDHFNAVGILFPAVWIDAAFQGTLAAGTPIAQCFPIVRDELVLSCEPFDLEATKAYDETANALLSQPGVYRKVYRAGPARDRNPPSIK